MFFALSELFPRKSVDGTRGDEFKAFVHVCPLIVVGSSKFVRFAQAVVPDGGAAAFSADEPRTSDQVFELSEILVHKSGILELTKVLCMAGVGHAILFHLKDLLSVVDSLNSRFARGYDGYKRHVRLLRAEPLVFWNFNDSVTHTVIKIKRYPISKHR